MGLVFNYNNKKLADSAAQYKIKHANNSNSVHNKHLQKTNDLTQANRFFLKSLGYNVIKPSIRHFSKTTV